MLRRLAEVSDDSSGQEKRARIFVPVRLISIAVPGLSAGCLATSGPSTSSTPLPVVRVSAANSSPSGQPLGTASPGAASAGRSR